MGEAPDAQPLPLANGIEHQPTVFTDDLAGFCDDLAGFGRYILLQKILETAFTDKANAGGIFLVVVFEPLFVGNFTYGRFFQLTQWKQCAGNLAAVDRMQKVALIL